MMNNSPYRKNGNPGNKSEENGSGSKADVVFSQLVYDKNWIVSNATPALVQYAEKAGQFMAKNGLTNSKIRSIYGEIKRIQMGDFEKEKSAFYLLKPKVAYAVGREKQNEGLKLFKLIFDRAWLDVADKKTFHNFCNFIEAILAYHRAFGGKD